MKLMALVALPLLAWCAELDKEVTETTEEASRFQILSTTELNDFTERAIPHVHKRTIKKFTRYGFYRHMGAHGPLGTRRVFGGVAADLKDYPATCVMLDRYYSAKCSAAVVAPRWAITAAHCISSMVAYIKYNTHRPGSPDGNIVRVLFLYRHPQYEVEEKDEGNGMDVVLLHHDVGLVRVQDDMVLSTSLHNNPLVAMRRYNPAVMNREELQVMGYGSTEEHHLGEELVTTKLLMTHCYRSRWYHCICGIANMSRAADTGVCSGDSGGPVLYNGVQILLITPLPLLTWSAPDLGTKLNMSTQKAIRLEPPPTKQVFDTTERDTPDGRLMAENITWYRVYRNGRRKVDRNERNFSGEAENSMDYAAACVLLDRNKRPSCTAAIVTPRWVITAGHCMGDRITYVKYNTRRPTSDEGNISRVLHMYKHPDYQVEYKDEGLGMGVVLLHHDVGLVHVKDVMVLRAKLKVDPLAVMRRYSPADMSHKELQVIGFGRRYDRFERKSNELVTLNLQMRYCNRTTYYHCICGVARENILSDFGICSGDSGGPVLYRGVQVAVTSMTPKDCENPSRNVRGIPVTVFTYLYHYADMINATIRDANDSPPFVEIQSAKDSSDKPYLSPKVFVLVWLLLIFRLMRWG